MLIGNKCCSRLSFCECVYRSAFCPDDNSSVRVPDVGEKLRYAQFHCRLVRCCHQRGSGFDPVLQGCRFSVIFRFFPLFLPDPFSADPLPVFSIFSYFIFLFLNFLSLFVFIFCETARTRRFSVIFAKVQWHPGLPPKHHVGDVRARRSWRPLDPWWIVASLAKWLRHPPRERKIQGSNPACVGIFSGSNHTSDLKIGTPVATLPGAWRYGASAGTGWTGVYIL